VDDSPHIQALLEQAIGALRAEDYVRAVGIADQLAAAAPDNPAVRSIRAQALLGTEAAEEAFDEARRAADLDQDNEHVQQLLALAAWRTQRLTLAQQSFERAVDLSAHKPAVLADYAWFMATERGPRPAEQAATAAVAADDQSSTAWAALGLTQYRFHRRDEAEASLRRALGLNPNDLYAQSAMTVLLQDQRKDAKAEALAGLLEEHPGTEDFVASIREEAKRRRIAQMLLERNVDIDAPPREPPRYRWIWIVAAATLLALLFLLLKGFP
jgi:Tfp pilus assembly protein PilF